MKNYINKKKIYSVTTMTPHRISFAGGGTDYPKYYLKNGGSVINSTINKYLFVTVLATAEETLNLKYLIKIYSLG